MGSIVQLLEQSAQHHQDRIAIRSAQESVTYGALWQQVLDEVARLHDLGLQRGDRVALVLENSAEYAAACYGVMAAGGIAVALNPGAKSRELVQWLRASEARWVYSAADHRELSLACGELANPPARLGVGCGHAREASPAWQVAPDERAPAMLLFTSGTTGSPKGVLLSHDNLHSNTLAIVDYLELGASDTSVVVLPFFYSYGNSVLHTHLAVGATLVLETNLVYPHKIVESLATTCATGFAGVPSTYSLLLSRVDLSAFDLSSLRYVTQAGGAMPTPLIQRLRSALPCVKLFVMYGQTEATARICWLPPERLPDKVGSVGIAVSGVEVSIRREDGSVAPGGTEGEVWIRGSNVMLGYWNDEPATAKVKCGDWLRTGDLGHQDEEGYLYLAGRRSDMIKTGAHRVNPLEIEEVVLEMPEIAEVAVVPTPDEHLGDALCAVVVLRPGVAVSEMQVKAWCRARLSGHKVPKVVAFAPALPRTASGKVKRQELAGGRMQ